MDDFGACHDGGAAYQNFLVIIRRKHHKVQVHCSDHIYYTGEDERYFIIQHYLIHGVKVRKDQVED